MGKRHRQKKGDITRSNRALAKAAMLKWLQDNGENDPKLRDYADFLLARAIYHHKNCPALLREKVRTYNRHATRAIVQILNPAALAEFKSTVPDPQPVVLDPAIYREPKSRHKREESFYMSEDWRRLRYRVLKKYGRRCMCCGLKADFVHVDHIKPRSKYPELELVFENLQVLCDECNLGKGTWDETDWRIYDPAKTIRVG